MADKDPRGARYMPTKIEIGEQFVQFQCVPVEDATLPPIQMGMRLVAFHALCVSYMAIPEAPTPDAGN